MLSFVISLNLICGIMKPPFKNEIAPSVCVSLISQSIQFYFLSLKEPLIYLLQKSFHLVSMRISSAFHGTKCVGFWISFCFPKSLGLWIFFYEYSEECATSVCLHSRVCELYLCHYDYLFYWPIPSSAQGLFLELCSEITPETICWRLNWGQPYTSCTSFFLSENLDF